MRIYQKLLSQASFHSVLQQMDLKLLEEVRQGGCPLCDGALHRSDFNRVPRGIGARFRGAYSRRYSLCCDRDGCRHRVTPFSVRFLGRKQYVGAVMVVVGVMLHGVSVKRAGRIRKEFGVSRAIVEHWRHWWRRLAMGPFWKSVRGQLAPGFKAGDLPKSLLETFEGAVQEQLIQVLRFLRPLTSGNSPGALSI